jgi:hypothetical protein
MPWQQFAALLLFSIFGSAIQSSKLPAKMTSVIAQMSGSNIPADSFSTQPKTYWRAGSQYCRVDEEADAKNGIHGRLIINEPDSWLVNLADNTAKHIVDQGPTFNCRLPLFAFDPQMAKSKIGELEFGKELEFFRANGATAVEGPKLAFKANYYTLTLGDSVLKLIERDDIHAPIMIALIRNDDVVEIRYLLWDDQVPFKAELFAKPAGVTIEEIKWSALAPPEGPVNPWRDSRHTDWQPWQAGSRRSIILPAKNVCHGGKFYAPIRM